MQPVDNLPDHEFDALTPRLRTDLLTRFIENEAVSWSPLSESPTLLDPVASIVYQLIDGSVSVADLVADVHEAVGVPETIARNRLRRILHQFDSAGLLSTSQSAPQLGHGYDLFPGPLNT